MISLFSGGKVDERKRDKYLVVVILTAWRIL